MNLITSQASHYQKGTPMFLHRTTRRVALVAAVAGTLLTSLATGTAAASDNRLTPLQLKHLVAKVDFSPVGWYASAKRAHGQVNSAHHWCGTLQPSFSEGYTWATHKGSSLTIEVDQQASPAEATTAYNAIAKLKFNCPGVMVSHARGLSNDILDVFVVAGDGSRFEELLTVQGSSLLWSVTQFKGPWTPTVLKNGHRALHALAAAYKTAAQS